MLIQGHVDVFFFRKYIIVHYFHKIFTYNIQQKVTAHDCKREFSHMLTRYFESSFILVTFILMKKNAVIAFKSKVHLSLTPVLKGIIMHRYVSNNTSAPRITQHFMCISQM